jgi:hypothetical protein
MKPEKHQIFGRMISMETPSSKLKILNKYATVNSLKKISEFHEDVYEESSEEFFSCYQEIFPPPST